MDDMLLSGQHARELTKLIRQLHLKFAMKDFGPARHILSMKISQNQNRRQLFLSQSSYIRHVLERFNMQSTKYVSTLHCLSENTQHLVQRGKLWSWYCMHRQSALWCTWWSQHGLPLLSLLESSADSCTIPADCIGTQSNMCWDNWWAQKILEFYSA